MKLLISIERDEVTPTMRAISDGLSQKLRINSAAANGALVLVQRNFTALAGSNRNQLGAPSSGFWQRMHEATYADADAAAGYVRMPREVALRYFGGTVTPKKAENLAIPARTEAYNKSPRDMHDLRLAVFAGGTLALVQAASQKVKWRRSKGQLRPSPGAETAGGLVFYWLVKSATIAGNTAVLPAADVLQAAANSAVASYLRLIMRRRS